MTDNVTRFKVYCKMTCLGGSERGECPCRSPMECELQDHPNYDAERTEARERMVRYARNLHGSPTGKS